MQGNLNSINGFSYFWQAILRHIGFKKPVCIMSSWQIKTVVINALVNKSTYASSKKQISLYISVNISKLGFLKVSLKCM